MNKNKHSIAAIAMILLCGVLLTMMDATTKYIGGLLSVVLVLSVRFTVQTGVMALWIFRTRGIQGFVTSHPRFQVLRGVLLLVFSMLVFFSLRHMPLAEFTAIMMLSPVLVTAILGLLMNQPVNLLRWMLLLGGFIGSLIVIRPGSGIFGAAALLPLMTMVAMTANSLLSSRLAVLDNPFATQFYTGITGCLLMLPLAVLQADVFAAALWVLTPLQLALLILIGLLSTFAHLLMVMAFKHAPAATLMPFTYAQIGFAAILGWMVFHHVPDFWTWVGMLTIAACGSATAWLNMRKG